MANRGISVAHWETWKSLIYELYLRRGWTLEQVTLEIHRQYGVRPSSRQCKQRLKSWGYDSKRIPKRIWVAFNVVDCYYRHRCRFQIYVRDGHQTRTITPEAIRKQIARYKNEPPESLHMPLLEAQQDLHNFGVRVFAIHDSPLSLPTQAEDENDNPAECTDQDGSDSTVSANETSSVNIPTDLLHVASSQPSPSRESKRNVDNHQPKPSPQRQLPPLNTKSPDLYENSLFLVRSRDANRSSSERFSLDESSKEILDFTAELAVLDSTIDDFGNYHSAICSNSPTKSIALLGRGAKHDALHFVSCYVRNVAAVEEAREFGEQHEDRCCARRLLQNMLSQNNAHLPSALNYLTTIMHHRASFEIYFAFLEDSWSVINMKSAFRECDLATYIVFLCKSAGDDQELAEAIPHSQESLQKWSRQILTPADFRTNLDRLVEVYGRESSPCIIMRYQYAWSLLQEGHTHMALELLVKTLDLSQNVLGHDHLITINGLAITARALEKICRNDEAAAMYEDCIQRFGRGLDLLMPSKVRMQARLARVYMLQGRFKEAEMLLLQALEWRRAVFGMLHARTWDVVSDLTEVYRHTLGEHHAEAFYTEQRRLHNEAYENWRNQQSKSYRAPLQRF